MDQDRDHEMPSDLSALAWVQEELRRTLDNAHKSLRRHLRAVESDGEIDGGSTTPTALLQARSLIHQGAGALEMIGLPAPARLLTAGEQALQRLIVGAVPFDQDAVNTLERASFALLDFLRRALAGKAVSPLLLFPQYRAVSQLAGVERIHPADLWMSPAADPMPSRATGAAPSAVPADARNRQVIESQLLKYFRTGDAAASRRIGQQFHGLAQTNADPDEGLWPIAAAFFEAQSAGLLPTDIYAKRMASRLLAQLRAAERGITDTPERLVQDLLFFCSRARRDDASAPGLTRVRSRHALPELDGVDYEQSKLGRFDPALIPAARRRVAALKETWSSVAGGDLAALPGIPEQAALVADSVQQLYPDGLRLARSLQTALESTVRQGRTPHAELAMEVATTLLCLDASLDEVDPDQPDLQQRIQRLAERLETVSAGQAAAPLEPWVEELYRDVSDRQSMGSVVQELRATLAEVEQQLDRFTRQPDDRDALMPVPSGLASMRGVFSVLGLDHAAQAVQRMRDEVQHALAQGVLAPLMTEQLADNLGALSFLIDMLGVQPQLAKALFRFDPQTGRFAALMGRARGETLPPVVETRLIDQAQQLAANAGQDEVSDEALSSKLADLSDQATAADQPGLAHAADRARYGLEQATDDETREAARADVVQALNTFANTSQVPFMPAPAPAGHDNDDMREIFLEEAREVLAQGHEALGRLDLDPQDLEAMTALRRAFHTLKGSSRMVGLKRYGEAAWACEQLFNARLADAIVEAQTPLRNFTGRALSELAEWTDQISLGQDQDLTGLTLIAAADALRLGTAVPLEQPVADALEAPELAPPVLEIRDAATLAVPMLDPGLGTFAAEFPLEMPGLPELPDLPELPELIEPASAPIPSIDWPNTTHQVPVLASGDEVDLELDLSALEDPAAASVVPPDTLPATDSAQMPHLDTLPGSFDETTSAIDPSSWPELHAEPSVAEPDDAERYKLVGSLRIQITLFNIFLNEADEQSRRLCVELQEWQLELNRPVGDLAVALAHSLAGNSATVGYLDLSNLARRLEHALERSCARGGGSDAEVRLYLDVADEIRRLLHQFAAGFLKPVSADLLARLDRHEQDESGMASHHAEPDFDDAPVTMMSPLNPLGAVRFSSLESEASEEVPAPAVAAPVRAELDREADFGDLGEDLEAADAIDPELFEIFVEEGRELLPELAEQLRQWEQAPDELNAGVGAMRALHTFKGGARLAGAMRLGELAHRLESAIEQLTVRGAADPAVLAQLHAGSDVLAEEFERLAGGTQDGAPAEPERAPGEILAAISQALAVVPPVAAAEPSPAATGRSAGSADAQTPATEFAPVVASRAVAWDRVAGGRLSGPVVLAPAETLAAGSVRVRAPLLDRLVSHAGEVGIARARMESDMGQMQGALKDLTENLERLRRQLRDVELQAETQMASRLEAARHSQQAFDPLEMDRFTRVQELTRMMAESVNDVGTVQRGLQQTLQDTEDQLAVQARLTRDLQDDLLRARMVEFDTLSDRLYRVVRQAAKESGKQVRLNLIGGGTELDRAVLDRMAPPFEHLLRNAVVHGIEPANLREATGKAASGSIEVSLRQAGNEVQIEVRDDGAGLDLARIAERGRALGLLTDESRPTEAELAGLIFTPGFSTAHEVTELAGRGIGMDVVRSEVTAMGGRIETASSTGQGTAFRMVLPLTTAVTQVVLLRCGELQVAVPSTLVELVRRVPAAEVDTAYRNGVLRHGTADIPFFWLGSLLQQGLRGPTDARNLSVVIVRSASQLVAVHVSEVAGNHEVVVKNLGPQLSRLPGLAGMSLLPTGATVLIYNPVALTAVYGDEIRQRLLATPQAARSSVVPAMDAPVRQAPLVMVVDDSLTVRRVTQRLLQREGYRVVLAKDGLDALERLSDETPAVMLCDIEMPRMDGFDLVRNVRGDVRLAALPVVMITSRIAEKHQEHARELGVNHYLGKPYDEDLLLSLVRRYAGEATVS